MIMTMVCKGITDSKDRVNFHLEIGHYKFNFKNPRFENYGIAFLHDLQNIEKKAC